MNRDEKSCLAMTIQKAIKPVHHNSRKWTHAEAGSIVDKQTEVSDHYNSSSH